MEATQTDTKKLIEKINQLFALSSKKIKSIEESYDFSKGTPVYTVKGKYTSRGWTEWTEGFFYGMMLLQYDGNQDEYFLEHAKQKISQKMPFHVSHFGVHDHGFNTISTYGNLLRLMVEGKIPENKWEKEYYSLAIKQSASIQANRWTKLKEGGFIYSFNGPHSLFVDTIRTCRVLLSAHTLGHFAQGENDEKISLLKRAQQHLFSTAKYSVFYGNGRDSYDCRGRVAHESIFNINDGAFRCPNSQQGYSGFSTWTRGLAWAILGFAEELEFFQSLGNDLYSSSFPKDEFMNMLLNAAKASCDFYINNTPVDGIPYWDTGAPGLTLLDDYLNKKSQPINDFEPIDSSAATIAAQGFIRLGKYLESDNKASEGEKYIEAGLTIANSLFSEPYISTQADHQGLILHSVYHRPNGWDYIPENHKIPFGESSMWGDYHAMELALYIKRLLNNEKYYTWFC